VSAPSVLRAQGTVDATPRARWARHPDASPVDHDGVSARSRAHAPQHPRAWTPHVIDFRFILDDLARVPALSLAARPVSPLVAVTLFLFKRARYARDLLAELQEIAAVLQRLDASAPPDEQRSALLTYTWDVGGVDIPDLSDFVRKHTLPNLEATLMNTTEKLLAAGREEGRRAAKAETLLALLREKFGDVHARFEQQIGEASVTELDVWLKRVLVAQRAEDVIKGA
jgi:hypothetical protein